MKTIHHTLCAMVSGGIAQMGIKNDTLSITVTGDSAFAFSESLTFYSDHVCLADTYLTVTDGYECIYAGVALFNATAIHDGMLYQIKF